MNEMTPTSPSRRVLLLANTDWYLFNFRLSLAQAVRDRGWDVILASPAGRFVDAIGQAGFRWVHASISRKGMNPILEILSVGRLAALYRRERPALVHHFTIKPVFYGSAAARLAGVPSVVNSVTGLGHLFYGTSPAVRLARASVVPLLRAALARRGTSLIFENQSDRDYYVANRIAQADRTTVIQGVGVDVKRFAPSAEPQGIPLIVMASRMLWEKGVGEFVRAAQLLAGRGVKARFALIGEPDPGNPTSVPEAQLSSWAQQGVVEWWGFRDDMPQVLAQSHIVVLPSYGEGVPTILLEAGSAGRPAVATDIPGCRAVIRDGVTGSLVPREDPSALANALERLIRDPALRQKMGAAARAWIVGNYADEGINRATIGVYETLLGTGRARGNAGVSHEASDD